MKEPILKAVAMPPKLFWAPMTPAMFNMAVQSALMFVGLAVTGSNPLWFLISIGVVHIGIMIYGMRDPHLSKMMESLGKTHPSRNIYDTGGNKFAS